MIRIVRIWFLLLVAFLAKFSTNFKWEEYVYEALAVGNKPALLIFYENYFEKFKNKHIGESDDVTDGQKKNNKKIELRQYGFKYV